MKEIVQTYILPVFEFIEKNSVWIIPMGAFFVTPIRDCIVKKVQLSIDKTKEETKSINDGKLYVTKVRFDKEFDALCMLSNKSTELLILTGDGLNYLKSDVNFESQELEKLNEDAIQAFNGLLYSAHSFFWLLQENIVSLWEDFIVCVRDMLCLLDCLTTIRKKGMNEAKQGIKVEDKVREVVFIVDDIEELKEKYEATYCKATELFEKIQKEERNCLNRLSIIE